MTENIEMTKINYRKVINPATTTTSSFRNCWSSWCRFKSYNFSASLVENTVLCTFTLDMYTLILYTFFSALISVIEYNIIIKNIWKC